MEPNTPTTPNTAMGIETVNAPTENISVVRLEP
jgi:hypothetical protein